MMGGMPLAAYTAGEPAQPPADPPAEPEGPAGPPGPPAAPATPTGPAGPGQAGPQALAVPPPGHPERLVPGQPPSAVERLLWRELGGDRRG